MTVVRAGRSSASSIPGPSSRTTAAAKTPVAVAMSGGLDSSVVASLLARDHESVIGVSMLLWDRSQEQAHGRCCGALDLGDARRVAGQIGIPHYTLRMDSDFRRLVVEPFVDDYLAGRTPSPCIRCNTFVKFDLLLERVRAFGVHRLATGHYARIVEGEDGFELHAARDQNKDQSYYLFELSQEQLGSALFPLGEMTKDEVRELARSWGLVVAEKGESYEVCFVSDSVQQFVEQESGARSGALPALSKRGAEVVDATGETLGRGGAPYYRYTVGQRRGLGVSAGKRLYVLDVDAQRNRVTVGLKDELKRSGLVGGRLHWIGRPPQEEIRATVKIRSRHPGARATVRSLPSGHAEVQFDQAQTGVAPGQAAVFYRGTQVLGGCWIESSLPSSSSS